MAPGNTGKCTFPVPRYAAHHEKVLGERPLGIYQGKPNANTRKLIVEEVRLTRACF